MPASSATRTGARAPPTGVALTWRSERSASAETATAEGRAGAVQLAMPASSATRTGRSEAGRLSESGLLRNSHPKRQSRRPGSRRVGGVGGVDEGTNCLLPRLGGAGDA
eukprot:14673997-Alexandrium_andersonii.AAC.1